jgi:hypothetical protein
MSNCIHDQARKVMALFIEAGEAAYDFSTSTNRNGDHSAYFSAMGRRFRISDHDCNTDFRSDVLLVRDMTMEQVVAFIAKARKADAIAAAERDIINAEKAAVELARQNELDALAKAAELRKAAWAAYLAGVDTSGMTQTAISKIEKPWRKENPIEAFM